MFTCINGKSLALKGWCPSHGEHRHCNSAVFTRVAPCFCVNRASEPHMEACRRLHSQWRGSSKLIQQTNRPKALGLYTMSAKLLWKCVAFIPVRTQLTPKYYFWLNTTWKRWQNHMSRNRKTKQNSRGQLFYSRKGGVPETSASRAMCWFTCSTTICGEQSPHTAAWPLSQTLSDRRWCSDFEICPGLLKSHHGALWERSSLLGKAAVTSRAF